MKCVILILVYHNPSYAKILPNTCELLKPKEEATVFDKHVLKLRANLYAVRMCNVSILLQGTNIWKVELQTKIPFLVN